MAVVFCASFNLCAILNLILVIFTLVSPRLPDACLSAGVGVGVEGLVGAAVLVGVGVGAALTCVGAGVGDLVGVTAAGVLTGTDTGADTATATAAVSLSSIG